MRLPIAFAAAAFLLAGTAAASPLSGDWRAPSKHAVIQMYDCGAQMCGRVVSSDDLAARPGLKDIFNKDKALRDRPVKGLTMITGMSGGPVEWTGGALYDPSSGNTYHGSMTMKDADTVDLKGCIFGPLCRTQTWVRVR